MAWSINNTIQYNYLFHQMTVSVIPFSSKKGMVFLAPLEGR